MGNRQSTIGNAFTLVELMISIALVLLLLVGVNQVFRLTGETVGAGQALSAASRDIRSAQATINEDFRNLATDGPIFMISCRHSFAFQSLSDQQSDYDFRSETTNVGDTVNATQPNYRSHRQDILQFFVRGRFARQTGDGGRFVNPETSSEAKVWYGMARLPSDTNNDGVRTYYAPGDTSNLGLGDSNVNNIHGSHWVLARAMTLLRDPAQIPPGTQYIKRWATGDPTGNPAGGSVTPQTWATLNAAETALTPLSMRSLSTDSTVTSPIFQQSSRYDLMGATMDSLRGVVSGAIAADPWGNTFYGGWWRPLLYEDGYIVTGSGPEVRSRHTRFDCNPWISRPLTSDGMAKTSTYFVGNVAQFIVEFAGDYLTQSPDGTVTGLAADGTIDFVVDRVQNPAGVRRIRWYGRPRDVNGDGIVLGGGNNNSSWWADPAAHAQRLRDMVDVVPLLDIRNCFNSRNKQWASFEKETPDTGGGYYWSPESYSVPSAWGTLLQPYTCIWVNDTPSMVRILMQIVDPSDRLRNGQWSEMVFSLK
jgi:prepilin-type N-terminal cleavage/methylation domain-containing protein